MSDTPWIWCPETADGDCYVQFRRTVKCGKPATLRIAASTQFELFVNGSHRDGWQFSDFADQPTFTEFQLTPAQNGQFAGQYAIEITIHWNGVNYFTAPLAPPGLWAELEAEGELIDTTGESWECQIVPAYRQGWKFSMTVQLGQCFWYDARNSPDENKWKPAVTIAHPGAAAPVARPIPPMREQLPPVVRIVQAGTLFRQDSTIEPPAAAATNDFLKPTALDQSWITPGTEAAQTWLWNCPTSLKLDPATAAQMPLTCLPLSGGANGWYLIADLGRETTGFLTFTIDASAGTVVDIAHGEHLDDGRVRTNQRYCADRYICREGVNSFTYRLRRFGTRYLELHLTNAERPPKIGYIGLLPTWRDLEPQTRFSSSDTVLERLDEVGIHTLKCCQHEHYEDCPWREQALYAYDSRNQALYGYYVWGNYDFAENCFRLLGKSYEPQRGYLELIAPGKCELDIPIFSLAWISALHDLYMHSGRAPKADMLEIARKLLDGILSRPVQTPAGDIYEPGEFEGVWNFCEWVPGLDRTKAKFQAPFNLYLVEALQNATRLGIGEKYAAEAARLGGVLEKLFWSEADGLYRTDETQTRFHEHTQVMMLYNGLVPAAKQKALVAKMHDPAQGVIASTFSSLPYWVYAMKNLGPEFRAQIMPRLRKTFLPLLEHGATTLWETELGGDDFSYAGSLCHGWSSIPTYYFRAGILGVTPVKPGFTEFRVEPDADCLHQAEGSVPTPYGPINVAWKLDAGGKPVITKLEAPPQCKAVNC